MKSLEDIIGRDITIGDYHKKTSIGYIKLVEGMLLRIQPNGNVRPYLGKVTPVTLTVADHPDWIVLEVNGSEENVNVNDIHSFRVVTEEEGFTTKKLSPAKREYPEGMPGTYLHPQEEGVKT